MYWLVGYNLMYGVEEGGYIGALFDVWSADDSAISAEEPTSPAATPRVRLVLPDGFLCHYGIYCIWYGCRALKLWPFLIFTLFLTGFIYPIVGGWEWGTGWLDAMGLQLILPAQRLCTQPAVGLL